MMCVISDYLAGFDTSDATKRRPTAKISEGLLS